MSGICGILNIDKNCINITHNILKMNHMLRHRGRDDFEIYTEEMIGLGYTGTLITDKENGSQPMCNEDGSIWIVYTGEIYNHRELRQNLKAKGHRFRSCSDTEVVLHCYEEYGARCPEKLNGMFAFGIWDIKKDRLLLVRDRLGIKPLYYSMVNGCLLFASEIKSILQFEGIDVSIELMSVPEYMYCTTLLSGKTMFKGIYSLEPASGIVVQHNEISHFRYWDLIIDDLAEATQEYYEEKIDALLQESVRLQLMGETAVGSMLSGGLDSSLITAMVKENVGPLPTFTMEYIDNHASGTGRHDIEAARIMADAFGTLHQEYLFHAADFYNSLEKTIYTVEKPVDLTTPSLMLMYQEIKKKVDVVFSGEGADELFGGYYFFMGDHTARPFSGMPWSPNYSETYSLLNQDVRESTHFVEQMEDMLVGIEQRNKGSDKLNQQLLLFIKFYLLEMLERQDKTSMAWGLEVRAPFLDHRLVELAANMPSIYKYRNGVEKYILKEIAANILPKSIVDRQKKPLPFPIDPRTLYERKNFALELTQSGGSHISQYFDKKKAKAFFEKKDGFEGMDNLAIFRTSYALIVLELWHKVFHL